MNTPYSRPGNALSGPRLVRWQPLPDLALFLVVNILIFFSARLALLYFLLPDIARTDHILRALYIGLKFGRARGRGFRPQPAPPPACRH